jgi:hypothetical protein
MNFFSFRCHNEYCYLFLCRYLKVATFPKYVVFKYDYRTLTLNVQFCQTASLNSRTPHNTCGDTKHTQHTCCQLGGANL